MLWLYRELYDSLIGKAQLDLYEYVFKTCQKVTSDGAVQTNV